MIPELIVLSINGNKELLGEAWQNLLDNAIKFTPVNGRIIVTMELLGDISIVFRDNGNGMDEETQLHIFEKFYQGANQPWKKGSGLGFNHQAGTRNVRWNHYGAIRAGQRHKLFAFYYP